MTQARETLRALERLRVEYGQVWRISTTRAGWQGRLQWRAERLVSPDPQVLRTETPDELEAALDFQCRLHEVRQAHGDTWLIGCQVKEEGVPRWAWAQRRSRIAHVVGNAFSAPSPEELAARLRAADREQERFPS